VRVEKKTMRRNRGILITIVFVIVACAASNVSALDPPPITPIDKFFVLGSSPPIPPDWHLVVDGAVESPLSLTLDQLMQYPATTAMSTLECNFDVGPSMLVSNANWTGVPLNTIIQDANLAPEALSITFHAVDGYVRGPFNLDEVNYYRLKAVALRAGCKPAKVLLQS